MAETPDFTKMATNAKDVITQLLGDNSNPMVKTELTQNLSKAFIDARKPLKAALIEANTVAEKLATPDGNTLENAIALSTAVTTAHQLFLREHKVTPRAKAAATFDILNKEIDGAAPHHAAAAIYAAGAATSLIEHKIQGQKTPLLKNEKGEDGKPSTPDGKLYEALTLLKGTAISNAGHMITHDEKYKPSVMKQYNTLFDMAIEAATAAKRPIYAERLKAAKEDFGERSKDHMEKEAPAKDKGTDDMGAQNIPPDALKAAAAELFASTGFVSPLPNLAESGPRLQSGKTSPGWSKT